MVERAMYLSMDRHAYAASWPGLFAHLAFKYGADPLETQQDQSKRMAQVWALDMRPERRDHQTYNFMRSVDTLESFSRIWSCQEYVYVNYHDRRRYIRKHPDLRACE